MSRFGQILRIGARQIASRPHRAVATVASVALCVGAALAAVSLADGLRALYTDRVLDVSAHVTVTARDARGRRSDMLLDVGSSTGAVALGATGEREDRLRIRNVATVLRSLERQLGDRLVVASPYMETQVLATHGTSEVLLGVKGVEPDRESRLAELPRVLAGGRVARLAATRHGVLLGHKAAAALGAGAGDRIRAVSMTGETHHLVVIGVYDLDIDAADRSAIVNLRLAQTMARALPSEASGIAMQLRDPSRADAIAAALERSTGRSVETWEDANPDALGRLELLRVALFVVAGLVTLLGGILLSHALIIAISERRADIAQLSTLGLSMREIELVFATNGTTTALVATAAGCVVGAIIIAAVALIPSESVASLVAVESGRIPMAWRSRGFMYVIALTPISGLIASLMTARLVHYVEPVAVTTHGERP